MNELDTATWRESVESKSGSLPWLPSRGLFVSVIIVSLGLGIATTTRYGLAIVGAIVALVLLGFAVGRFQRDPIQVFLAVWVFEVFQAPVAAGFGYNSSLGSLIRQVTDVLILLLLTMTLWRALTTKRSLSVLAFALPGMIVALLGLVSSFDHHVAVSVWLTGAWLGLKVWVLLSITVLLPWRMGDYERVYRWFTAVGVVVSLLGVIDFVGSGIVASTLHTKVVPGPGSGYRSTAVQSIFVHPGEFSLFMSILVALTAASYASRRRSQDLLLLLLFASVDVLSLRLKGVLSLVVVLGIIVLCNERGSRRNIVMILSVAAVVGVFIYSFEGSVITRQLQTYASSENTARAKLYTAGEDIARNDFPLGAGFGRFGSYPSRTHYSPVYEEYGLSQQYGLSRAFPEYLDDTSWPSVMGETGLLGFAAYVLGFFGLIAICYRRLRTVSAGLGWLPLSGLCVLAVVAVDSLGDPTLFDWIAATSVALVLGPTLVLGPKLGTASDP
jgi:hypothetical protein